MKIAILGRKKDTVNYVNYVEKLSAIPISTLNPGEITGCDALILPGGGDITPAFYGERMNGSRNIDTELDILQFQALEYAVHRQIPILGICKGLQTINVAFGGTLVQDMPTSPRHSYQNGDQYHNTYIQEGSCLHKLYGSEALVNSAHHQCIKRLGSDLKAIQWCPEDNCVEAIIHETLPILGVQWHPERINPEYTSISGKLLLAHFLTWTDNGRP